MSSEQIDKQLAELTHDHAARRVLAPPRRRAMVWSGLALLTGICLYWAVQPFRPGCVPHLLSNPALLIEILSAACFVWYGALWAFRSSIPGARTSTREKVQLASSALLFLAAIGFSFSHLAASSTDVGGRAACSLEVIVCAGITFVGLLSLLRRGYPRFSVRQVWLVALIAMLPAAALMQLACAYNPMHGLLHHYAPMLALAVLALTAQKWLRR